MDNPNFPPTRRQQQLPSYKTIKGWAIMITGGIIVLIILAGILIVLVSIQIRSKVNSKQLRDGDDSRLNIPIHSTIVEDIPINLRFVSREGWDARNPTGELDKLKLPVSRVIISHSASETCHTMTECTERLQEIQKFNMDSLGWNDIGSNFMIGADGLVYVGRGWYQQGAHTKGYNIGSVGISLVGTFTTVEPTEKQMLAVKYLIQDGVRRGVIATNYKIYGARQLSSTESPGETVFNIIKTWPHFSKTI